MAIAKEVEDVIKQVAEQGWSVVRDTNHIVLSNGKERVTLPRTPSDHRAVQNQIADLRRHGLVINGQGGGPDKSKHEAAFKAKRATPRMGLTKQVRDVLLNAGKKLTNAELRALTGVDDRVAIGNALTRMKGEVLSEQAPYYKGRPRTQNSTHVFWLKGMRFDRPEIPSVLYAEMRKGADAALQRVETERIVVLDEMLANGEVREGGVTEVPGQNVDYTKLIAEIHRMQSINQELNKENARLMEQSALVRLSGAAGFAGVPSEFWVNLGKAVAALGGVTE